ncbi:hypothetical protein EC396_02510 [Lutibacter sp. HS1-25]|uniref:type IX secretion system outer membrane channel protein PorV n=1 Tax=Lutibacter sp. HS1-25 TaxID=2485000 RepID=UPI001010E13B|nr:type IX secretion system outer membrane channel protein PorV [Lutibacter sp. HS1-25]RXP63317.1 hypothetical protein EC396_02510 [Lutibacter sp. HS1-25]
MKKITFLTFIAVIALQNLYAQEQPNPIPTAAPFLLIAPDARSGGLGDIGASTSADAFSQHYNAAKYAFMPAQYSLGIYYTPWLQELTNDVFLGGVNFANRINERSSWSASLNYFNLGEIDLTDSGGVPTGTEKLNEFSLDGAYSLKLSENYGMGITLRYVRSDLGIESANTVITPVNTFTVDISGFYQSDEENFGDFNGVWRAGFNISNMGPKVSYSTDGQESYMPTNLRLGGGFDFILDNYNKVTLTTEFNKLLVPTPNVPFGDGKYLQPDKGFFEGMIGSFSDAPGGGKEEMQEITWALGAEYMYNDAFSLRTGYFHESKFKGSRQFMTLGAGFKFKSARLDLSYLFNTADINNPLENTLRFSLSFDFGELYEIY